MAKIGKWGDTITFEVNADYTNKSQNKQMKILTFKDMKRTAGARWKSHNIVGHPPKKEFQGRQAQTISLKITFDARHQVKPRAMMKKLRVACQKGSRYYLIIGGKKVCSNKMYIESLSEEWDEIWSKGELVRSTVSVNFAEYI